MAGPTRRALGTYVVPPGEAQVQYAPSALAYKIQNLEWTPEGTLRSIRGFCQYEPDRGGSQYGYAAGTPVGYVLSRGPTESQGVGRRIHGVFHANLLDGKAPTLVVRAGPNLYMHAGWYRSWIKLTVTSNSTHYLTSDHRMVPPDHFVVVNDQIIWSNGIDRPLVISHNGLVVPLGFKYAPGMPVVDGPEQPASREDEYPNSSGYSWPGRIGTIGDYVDANEGAVLAGEWAYYTQWEDIHGNLSPLSAPSEHVRIVNQQTNEDVSREGDVYDPDDGKRFSALTTPALSGAYSLREQIIVTTANVGDLQRQYVVRSTNEYGTAPKHAVACRLYRTADIVRHGPTPRLVEVIHGTGGFVYADNIPDSRLLTPGKQIAEVPSFSAITVHRGCLVGVYGTKVYVSQPGFPGTFPVDQIVTPDKDGAGVTATASHAGRLIAFTETSVVDITNGPGTEVTLARGVGCVAPRSIKALPMGMLVWLSRDGFYGLKPDGSIEHLSQGIHRRIRDGVAKGAMRRAVAVVDSRSREYRCAVTPAGEAYNSLMFCYDGRGFREIKLGLDVWDMCVTDDAREYVLMSGQTSRSDPYGHDVYVSGHEVEDFANADRTHIFRSAWLRGDDTALKPIHVHNLYLGMIDEKDVSIDVNIYSNGSHAPDADSPRKVKSVGVGVEDLTGAAVLGTAKTHARRLYWRRIPVGLQSVNTWAFELKSDSPFHIAAIAFQTSFATMGDELGRIPLGEDE